MGVFRMFHATAVNNEDKNRAKLCIAQIKNFVSEKCGYTGFIDYNDSAVAFAGSKDDMRLLLEICTQKSGGKKYLYASVDDEVSWYEWDFESLTEFEKSISEYIANRVNRTIKTVVKAENGIVNYTSYYLNEKDEWICFENDSCQSKLTALFISKTNKPTETIITYKLQ